MILKTFGFSSKRLLQLKGDPPIEYGNMSVKILIHSDHV